MYKNNLCSIQYIKIYIPSCYTVQKKGRLIKLKRDGQNTIKKGAFICYRNKYEQNSRHMSVELALWYKLSENEDIF